MGLPRVLVIHNEPVLPLDHPEAGAEHDVIESSGIIATILEEAGYETHSLGFAHDPRPLLDELRDRPPAVVFNMFEGIATQTGTEISVVALLEWLNVSFTGCPSAALSLGRDKVRTKFLLHGAGIPTPGFQVVDSTPFQPWRFGWPAIVKPALQDCSVGIEQASVVSSPEQLDRQVRYVLDRYGPPVLIEEFVFGRELLANIIEDPGSKLVSIPLAEICFPPHEESGSWPIYSYQAKWNVESPEFQKTPIQSVVRLEPEVERRVLDISMAAYRLIGLRDCGRVDLRLTEDQRPFILEVNPNPYLHSEPIFDGLQALGRTHPQFIIAMVEAALARRS